jgi:hypothetical protein
VGKAVAVKVAEVQSIARHVLIIRNALVLWLSRQHLNAVQVERGDEGNRQAEMANPTKCRDSLQWYHGPDSVAPSMHGVYIGYTGVGSNSRNIEVLRKSYIQGNLLGQTSPYIEKDVKTGFFVHHASPVDGKC